jgi:hypothetical protein
MWKTGAPTVVSMMTVVVRAIGQGVVKKRGEEDNKRHCHHVSVNQSERSGVCSSLIRFLSLPPIGLSLLLS